MAITLNTQIRNDVNGYTLDAKQVKGSYVPVETLAERDALPVATITEGSICYVTQEEKYYTRVNGVWVEGIKGIQNEIVFTDTDEEPSSDKDITIIYEVQEEDNTKVLKQLKVKAGSDVIAINPPKGFSGQYEDLNGTPELSNFITEQVVIDHNNDTAAHTHLLNQIAEAKSIAEGRYNALSFTTKVDLLGWLAELPTYIREDGKTKEDLTIGMNLYIEESGPDYWWNGTDLSVLLMDLPSNATATSDGLMSKQDKEALDKLVADGVEANIINKIKVNSIEQEVDTEDRSVDITVPTNVSELNNDSDFATMSDIPVRVSDLENDAEFITLANIPTDLSSFNNDVGFALEADIPTNVSELINDAEFITAGDIPYIPVKISDLTNDTGFVTKYVNDLVNYKSTEDLNVLLEDKVDKVDGYSLTKNNLTDELKENYDDAYQHSLDAPDLYEPKNTNIQEHIIDQNNPHNVTKAQVGLSNVDNTSDSDKPISTAQQTALDNKVDKNIAITGATKTKINYDSKGLVTGGSDLVPSDIGAVEEALNDGKTYARKNKSWVEFQRGFLPDEETITLNNDDELEATNVAIWRYE